MANTFVLNHLQTEVGWEVEDTSYYVLYRGYFSDGETSKLVQNREVYVPSAATPAAFETQFDALTALANP